MVVRWFGVRALVLSLLLVSGTASAEPVLLRMASLAPEGTAWAREMKAFSRDIEVSTHGAVRLKWYLGGIAGDEFAVLERIRKGQLDGEAGALLCEKLAPSLSATRAAGLFQSREESRMVYGHLRQRIDQEMAHAGFVNLGLGTFGPILVFSREPVRTLSDLRNAKIWQWDKDALWRKIEDDLGMHGVSLPVEEAARDYEDHRTDGFLAMPGAALAFQWSTQARYFMDLKLGMLPACNVISQRVFDTLPVEHQQAVRTAAAKLAARFEDVGASQDEALMSGLLVKQGLTAVTVSESFRTEFLEAARHAREKIDPALVPPDLMSQVLSWLADYRAERVSGKRR